MANSTIINVDELVNASSEAEENIISTLNKKCKISKQSEQQVTDNLNVLQSEFNTEIKNLKLLNSYYSTLTYGETSNLDTLKELYSEKQNELDQQNKNYTEDILTNNRKTFYERDAITTLEKWHTFFWYIYYICFVLVLLGIIFSTNSTPIYISFLFAGFILIYPYVINPIIYKGKEYFNVFYRIFPKNVYNNL